MENERTTLERSFRDEVDRIAEMHIANLDLKFERDVERLSEPLLRWLDFRLRYVDSRPRAVYVSNKFPKALAPDAEKGLHTLVDLFSNGGDVNPYQSKGLIRHNDSSGDKRQLRTDLLWADWGILHFHLTSKAPESGQYFAGRSDWLLFCFVGVDFVCLIDICHHDDENLFSNSELLRTMIRSWPELAERFRLKGASLARQESNTDTDISQMRKSGLSTVFEIDGAVYVGPGMGVTTASTPTRVSLAMMDVRRHTKRLVELVCDPSMQFISESKKAGVDCPVFRLAPTPKGLAVIEEKSDRGFLLPRQQDGAQRNALAELHDLLVPLWTLPPGDL